MSSGTIVDLINDYRAAVAPLAEKWWDWKQDQANEAEPLQKENAEEEAAEGEKGSDDTVPDKDDLPKDDQKDEEDGAA